MEFYKVLNEVLKLLRREGRVSYRALKRQFEIDDEFLDDLKYEIIKAKQLAIDEKGEILIWTGGQNTNSTSASVLFSADRDNELLSFTPPNLAKKVLGSNDTLDGERKQVTVLFVDITNSTALAEFLGPEAMHTLLNQFFQLALSIVHRYEGTINQFLGDGFMALFGAPVAHENHTLRAVLSALDIQWKLQEQRKKIPSTPEVRMGLNTGLVVVGTIGDNLRMDYTAVGDTTNLAARLQQAATPGQIIISETTYRLVEGFCNVRPLGKRMLKGKKEPVSAWELLTVQKSKTRLEVKAERGLTPFVGREQELKLLMECFRQIKEGHGQIVFIVGEPGIGKSRLLLEFRRHLNTEVTWSEGIAMPFGRSIAFYPLIDLLKRNFHIQEGEQECVIKKKIEQGVLGLGEDLQTILPYISYLLAVDPGDSSIQNMNPQLRRAEIFDALKQLILRAAEVHPQVIVFEDLHWVDKVTEAFLKFISDCIPASRILFLFSFRPGYTHPFVERTYYSRIVLSTLSTMNSILMLKKMLSVDRLPEEVQSLIIKKAEGNPFFVEEVVESLREVSAIRLVNGHLVLAKPLEEIIIPDTIHDVIMARIDRLEDKSKKTLQLASVIGREFTFRLVDCISDLRESTKLYLQKLKINELIYEKSFFPELVYIFKHALTQDVVYRSLLKKRRKELHRLIGLAIEELYVDRLAEHYEMLAYHFVKGEEWTKAFEYLLKSADKATQAFATREAIELYDEALEVAEYHKNTVDIDAIIQIYKKKAYLYYIQSDFKKSQVENDKLITLARQTGDQIIEGMALANISWSAGWDHDFDKALAYANQAIELSEKVDAKLVKARSYLAMGIVYQVSGKLNKGREVANRALIISREAGDAIHQSMSLNVAGEFKNWEGEFSEALHLQSEALQISRKHNLLEPLLYTLFTYGLSLTGNGDYQRALSIFHEGLELSEKVGAEAFHIRLLNCLGWLYMECGKFTHAVELNQKGTESARKWGDPETIANAELNLADIFLAKDDHATARQFLDKVYQLVHDSSTSEWMKWRYSMHLFVSFGEYWLLRGNLNKAKEFADKCLEIASRTYSQKYLVKGWRLKGEIAFIQKKWTDAGLTLQKALAIAQTICNPTQLWKTYSAIGRLHSEAGRQKQAQLSFLAARKVIEQIKKNVEQTELSANIDSTPVFQMIYDLSMPR